MAKARVRFLHWFICGILFALPVALFLVMRAQSSWRPRQLSRAEGILVHYIGLNGRPLLFSPDGEQVAIATITAAPPGSDVAVSQITIWNVRRQTPQSRIPIAGSATSIAQDMIFSRDGKSLVTAEWSMNRTTGRYSRRCSVRWWDTQSGQLQRTATLIGSQGTLEELAVASFSPDLQTLVVADCYALDVFDLTTQKLERTWPSRLGDAGIRKGIVFAPDSRTFLEFELSGAVRLRDGKTGVVIKTLPKIRNQILGAAFSPESGWLVCARWTNNSKDYVKFWNMQTGRPIGTVTESASRTSAFSSDGKTFAGTRGNLMTTIGLWDTHGGRLLRPLALPTTLRASALAFSPDDNTLAVACDDSSVFLWHIH